MKGERETLMWNREQVGQLLSRSFDITFSRARDEYDGQQHQRYLSALRHGTPPGSEGKRNEQAGRQAFKTVSDEVRHLLRDGVLPPDSDVQQFVAAFFRSRGATTGAQRAAAAAMADLDLDFQRSSLRTPLIDEPYADKDALDDLLPLLRALRLRPDLEQAIHGMSIEHPCALFFVDVDGFKQVNDREGGHDVGDRVLIEIARRIREVVGHKGRCYRKGGDEFVILLENFSATEAMALAERVVAAVNMSPIEGKQRSVSIGVAAAPDHASTAGGLLTAADRAMYGAKHAGRSRAAMSALNPNDA